MANNLGYLLFHSDTYYPTGAGDAIGFFSTVEELKKGFEHLLLTEKQNEYSYYEYLDIGTLEVFDLEQ